MKSTTLILAGIVTAILLLTACGRRDAPAPQGSTQQSNVDDHDDHDYDDHDSHGGHGHHGESIDLGTATIGEYTVRAARDEGEIKPGGDAPIDVWLTGDLSKIIAVRYWIGAEDAAGSIKARAEIENPATPNHWHAHAEIPAPMPPSSKLWVELDIEGQGKVAGSFELITDEEAIIGAHGLSRWPLSIARKCGHDEPFASRS